MATAAQIQSASVDADENARTPAQIVAMIDRAILNAYIAADGSLTVPWSSVGSDGTSQTRTMEHALATRSYYSRISGGGVIGQYVEFTERR